MADRDRASVLMLVPAGFLVLLALAAITFDYSHLYLANREATAIAEGAANDAVTFGVDQARLRAGGGVHLDPSLVEQAVSDAVAARAHDVHIVEARAVAITDTRVEVVVVASIDYVFVRAFPGMPRSATITVRALADAA